jgi:hypothetical protein
MFDILKQSLWKHFGASIDMLGNAISLCPDEVLRSNKRFYFIAYHSLIFLDYYVTIPPENFSSPLPFTLTEAVDIPKDALDDVVPDKIYTKKELLDYLNASREKLRLFLTDLTADQLNNNWIDGSGPMFLALSSSEALNYSVLDILFYNMQHVQHHAAQLNLLLRQEINAAPDYIAMTNDDL